MTGTVEAAQNPATRFRTKLVVAMMVVVSIITALTLYLAEQSATNDFERASLREFQGELEALHNFQQVRHAALVERCRALVRRPRIHAALEDNALDLLYPSAKDELRDLLAAAEPGAETSAHELRVGFYRFLDRAGAVIKPASARDIGELSAAEEAGLVLKSLPDRQQIGYFARAATGGGESLVEVIAMPIVSAETGEAIAALVLGFKPAEFQTAGSDAGIKRGIWTDGRLHLAAASAAARAELESEVTAAIRNHTAMNAEKSFSVRVAGAPHLFFYKQLNPGSLFPPAYEVCIYPLTELLERRAQLRWQVLGSAGILLLVGLATSNLLAARLSRPVEQLAKDSAENRAQRVRAEAALESTNEELLRSARFSANASHQLKTPVTVLRAGLEELLARPNLTAEECNEIAGLIHQTYRLASIIQDLLLLSRMDAGRLQLEFSTVNLADLIAGWLDDFEALPDPHGLNVETALAGESLVRGEQRYTTLILQNLLENARKYNRLNGRIRVATRAEDDAVFLTIGNTGRGISAESRTHIFERFHRGAMAENLPGHGLGLNLARELARIHKGDLRLATAQEDWTEFEVRFLRAWPAAGPNRSM